MSTKKSSIKPYSLLKKTRKVFGIKSAKINPEGSPEMTHEKTYKTADFIPAKTFALKPPTTTDEVFDKIREKAFDVAMKYPHIKKSLLDKKPAELKEIYVKYNEIYPQVLDFIQSDKEIKSEIGPNESNVKRAEKIAVAIALKSKSDIMKSLHARTRRNIAKLNISHKSKSASKSVSKSASKSATKSATKSASAPKEPKPTMGQLMKSIQNKPVEEKKVGLTTDDLVSMIHKAQVELREQELESLRTGKRVLV